MITWQGGARRFLETLNIRFTERHRKHAARKPSGSKCRENTTKRVRVIPVKCVVVNFIRYSDYTTFKPFQSRTYIVGKNGRRHNKVINSVQRGTSEKERDSSFGTRKRMSHNALPAISHFIRQLLGPIRTRMSLFRPEKPWCCHET